MSNLKAFRHLVWKDARAVTPFAFAILVGLIVAELTTILISRFYPPTYGKLESLVLTIATLLPVLFAYSIGPFMVGTEEEKGTLSWLAALPLSWPIILLSKLAISLFYFCLLAAVSYVLVMVAFDSKIGKFDTGHRPIPETVCDMFLSGCFLWMASFLCSFLIRPPVWSLLAVGPVWTVLRGLLNQRFQDIFSRYDVSLADYLFIIATFVAITLITLWLARLRILRPWAMTGVTRAASDILEVYQPPRNMSISRPSQWTALLWQQWRQYSPVGLTTFVAFMIPSIVLARGTPWHNGEAGWVVLGIVIASSILGSMTFYGDAIKTRSLFFGERGLNATRLWFTRLLLSALFILPCLLTAYYAITHNWHAEDDVSWIAICIVMWCIGVVSPMMIKRPILSFFVPAVTVFFSFILLLWFFEVYTNYLWTILFACPVILLTSWHLCEPWLSRQLTAGYYAKLFGCAMLALMTPIMGIMASRVISAPRVDSHWRSATLAAVRNVQPSPARSAILSPNVSDTSQKITIEQLELELNGIDPIGQHATSTSVLTVLSEQKPIDEKALAMKVCLNWSGRVREAMLLNTVNPQEFCIYAENAEKWTLDSIESLRTEQIVELLKLFPSKELRKQSRLAAVRQMWAEFNRSLSYKNQSKQFAGLNLASYDAWFAFEGWRQNRQIDKAAEIMTEQIESGRNLENYETSEYVLALLRDAFTDIMDTGIYHRSNSENRATRYWEGSEVGWVFWIDHTENQMRALESKYK